MSKVSFGRLLMTKWLKMKIWRTSKLKNLLKIRSLPNYLLNSKNLMLISKLNKWNLSQSNLSKRLRRKNQAIQVMRSMKSKKTKKSWTNRRSKERWSVGLLRNKKLNLSITTTQSWKKLQRIISSTNLTRLAIFTFWIQLALVLKLSGMNHVLTIQIS